ncbi:hypothetical protein HK102_004719 [Quaeritorhiza haematococci]|nr:hypothetical protein HK102_004719 [Quaeritorhiza haematococci]
MFMKQLKEGLEFGKQFLMDEDFLVSQIVWAHFDKAGQDVPNKKEIRSVLLSRVRSPRLESPVKLYLMSRASSGQSRPIEDRLGFGEDTLSWLSAVFELFDMDPSAANKSELHKQSSITVRTARRSPTCTKASKPVHSSADMKLPHGDVPWNKEAGKGPEKMAKKLTYINGKAADG